MVDLEKELQESQTILMLVSGMYYNNFSIDVAKQLSKKKVGYITLNKTFNALNETFSKKSINVKNMTFIDAISRTITDNPPQTDKCYYVSSPSAMTELSIEISKFIKLGFDYIIFDSLTNLLIYEKKAPVAKFLSNLVNKIKGSNTKAVFFALKVDQHQELIQECSMFVDNVIDIDKQ